MPMTETRKNHHHKTKNTWRSVGRDYDIDHEIDIDHLVVDHIEGENTDGINILLHSSWTPSPVVAGGWEMNFKCWKFIFLNISSPSLGKGWKWLENEFQMLEIHIS